MNRLRTLWYKLRGKRTIGIDYATGPDRTCKVTAYWIGDKWMITGIEWL